MTINDKDIIATLQHDANQGFSMLLAKYKEPVYWHIRRLVVSHTDAQDASQETFVRVYKSLVQCRSVLSLRAWLMRVATNEALRLLELRNRRVALLDADSHELNTVAADCYVDYADKVAVQMQQAILSLPTKQQLAFNMRYYDDMDYDDIAEAMGTTPTAVKTNYHLAKQKIIKYMNTNEL